MARPRKEKTEPLQIRLPVELKKKLRLEAAMNDTTMSQILIDAYTKTKADKKK